MSGVPSYWWSWRKEEGVRPFRLPFWDSTRKHLKRIKLLVRCKFCGKKKKLSQIGFLIVELSVNVLSLVMFTFGSVIITKIVIITEVSKSCEL